MRPSWADSGLTPMKRFMLVLAAALPQLLAASAYEIGEAMESAAFWSSDPVLFVKRHAEAGFAFTSDTREGADSRQDGGVTYYGVPVYESRIDFGESGGVDRVELMLFATGGTEVLREVDGGDGRLFRQRVRVDKTVTKAEYGEILKTVRGRLAKAGAKPPATVVERTASASVHQARQTWPRTEIPTECTLTWNYEQVGKNAATFKPNFIRVAVNGPARLSGRSASAADARMKSAARGAQKIADNVVRESRGDVFIDNVPMVDQGQKGYCSVATAERVLRYYGVEIDEHEIAQAAGTSAEGGTDVEAMRSAVQAIGRRYKLGTVASPSLMARDVSARIAGLEEEVRAYNKAAQKLKRPTISEAVYVTRRGNAVSYSPGALDEAMDPEVRKEMRVNGALKSKYKRFLADVHQQIDKGIPLFWGVALGIYPEPGLPQTGGGHMRLIIGYNDKKKEILYTDSWGAGHELKRMPADWAWTISRSLLYLKPLAR